LLANVASSIANLIFLLVLARQSSLDDFGKAFFVIAISSVIPIALDTSSLQLITQRARPLGLKAEFIDVWLAQLFPQRAILILVAISIQTLAFLSFGLLTPGLIAICFLTMAVLTLSGAISSQLAQGQSRGIFLLAQVFSVLSAALACAQILVAPPADTQGVLLAVCLSKAGVLVVIVLLKREMPIILPRLNKVVRIHPRTSLILLGTQFVSSLSTLLDSILVVAFGFRLAAEYQLLQKPMLALGVLNVSIGQESTARSISGRDQIRPKIWAATIGGIVIGGFYGAATFFIIEFIVNRDLSIGFVVPTVIGMAFGISAITSFLGPQVLLSQKTRDLLVSAVGQVLLVLLMFFTTNQLLGVLSLALGVLAARIFAVVVQILALARD
jgi:hypothetical protein